MNKDLKQKFEIKHALLTDRIINEMIDSNFARDSEESKENLKSFGFNYPKKLKQAKLTQLQKLQGIRQKYRELYSLLLKLFELEEIMLSIEDPIYLLLQL
jgi:hypothetical protein